MALKHGSEHFSKLVYMEDGQVLVRRIHELNVQASDGSLHRIKGDKLPQAFVVFAGKAYKGLHLGQVLLSREPGNDFLKQQYAPPVANYWPAGRDAMHVVIGVIGAGMLSFLTSLASATF